MQGNSRGRRRVLVAATMAAAIGVSAVVGTGSAGASRSVRGFDGSTVTVAGIGIKSQLPRAEVGAQARIKRFNDTKELKGVKIKYAEFVDDQKDVATALSESRRLVTQVGVFAIVGDVSINNPGQYFAQQHVPYFGGGFDQTYCSSKPSTSLWGFSVQGCLSPPAPSRVSDTYGALYQYVSKKTGKKHPTFAIFGQDNDTSKIGVHIFAVAATGTGFKVTAQKNIIPSDIATVNDFSPYANAVIDAGAKGQQPDAINCVGGTECVQMWQQLKAQGYKGVYSNGIYSDLLVGALDGAAISNQTNLLSLHTANIDRMKADLDAYQAGAGAKSDLATVYGYASTDMFITALKKAAAKGKSNITPEAVQKVASTMTWGLPGLQGPAIYPASTVMTYPSCGQVSISDGTAWVNQVKFTCSKKTYSPNLKVG
jgi:ABC-type branched-subunit amino acid transport system substrate-binding protein